MKDELTITGLTANQKFICEVLWKMPSMHAVNDLCAAGGAEYWAMRDMMIAAEFDRVMEVDPEVTNWLTSL